ncbi:MAG: adenosyl-hopene transferase HpnH [Verrucomicrobia bacterium]|nr:adenosyl-hopene transferase HpnH [Verrucomicrobiota bacterium]
MRFPLALSAKIAGHIFRNKLRRVQKFALVLQLEPLHTCNLSCTGCGRIREYSTSLNDLMSLDDCLASAAECDAPMVSICGGEPTIYPMLEELVAGLLQQGRIVYICTNSARMRQKLRDYLAHTYTDALEPTLAALIADNLLTDKEAAEIRKGAKSHRPVIAPSNWLYWNVHVDSLERTHDLIVEREGIFRECIAAIKMAKALGFQVATNTTVYKETDMREIEHLFDFLSSLGVDGFTLSPGYDYDAAKQDMLRKGKGKPEDFFLTRKLTHEKFANVVEWGRKYPLLGTPAYLEFLAGQRDLHCTAWAIPTRNIRGWKAPCYLITDGHYKTYREMLDKSDWSKYGVFNGIVRDPRCENCMTHCGYEPTPSLGYDRKPGDLWKLIKYNFGPKPRPVSDASHVNAYNGVTSSHGHLTGNR